MWCFPLCEFIKPLSPLTHRFYLFIFSACFATLFECHFAIKIMNEKVFFPSNVWNECNCSSLSLSFWHFFHFLDVFRSKFWHTVPRSEMDIKTGFSTNLPRKVDHLIYQTIFTGPSPNSHHFVLHPFCSLYSSILGVKWTERHDASRAKKKRIRVSSGTAALALLSQWRIIDADTSNASHLMGWSSALLVFGWSEEM